MSQAPPNSRRQPFPVAFSIPLALDLHFGQANPRWPGGRDPCLDIGAGVENIVASWLVSFPGTHERQWHVTFQVPLVKTPRGPSPKGVKVGQAVAVRAIPASWGLGQAGGRVSTSENKHCSALPAAARTGIWSFSGMMQQPRGSCLKTTSIAVCKRSSVSSERSLKHDGGPPCPETLGIYV